MALSQREETLGWSNLERIPTEAMVLWSLKLLMKFTTSLKRTNKVERVSLEHT